ncbi:MAG: hypothetical protein ACM3KF_02600 [Acidobacteriota bacterium]
MAKHILPVKVDRGDGPVVVLLHGLGNNHKSWSLRPLSLPAKLPTSLCRLLKAWKSPTKHGQRLGLAWSTLLCSSKRSSS